MADYKDAGKGNLRINQKSKDSQPDFRGSCVILGTEFWVSGWNKSKEGEEWISLSFQEKTPQVSQTDDTQARYSAPANNTTANVDETDLPF